MHGWVVGIHALECACNLLGRPQPAQHGGHKSPQRPAAVQFGAWPGLKATLLAQALRRRAGVTAMAGVAPQLAADGAGAAALKAGYGPEAPALLAQRCQRHSVFWLQVFVSRSHLRTLPLVRVLHFRFETALDKALSAFDSSSS